ncbi:MAG: ABC transporter permease [Bifidobacteriaceae bacterium]|nr:ABC transporter permease [Bifidobacteriaceae bacterium]
MSTFQLWKLFAKRGEREHAHTNILAIIAFAASTGILLIVLSGVHGFIMRTSPDHTVTGLFKAIMNQQVAQVSTDASNPYISLELALSVFAFCILLVPLCNLAGAAARLAASTRDARLSALRLIGVTSSQVVKLTAIEAVVQAVVGTVFGVIIYVATMPLIMLIPFQSRGFQADELWVGIPLILLVMVIIAMLSLISAFISLRNVVISPLGVSKRVSKPLPSKYRAILGCAGLFAAMSFRDWGQFVKVNMIISIIMFIAVIMIMMAMFNIMGTWIIAHNAKRALRKPKNAALLIAMRRILDNPNRAWRNISGIALAVFIAGFCAIAQVFATMTDGSTPTTIEEQQNLVFLQDIGTGGTLTLVFAAILAAVSCGVMQAGNVYDQISEYRMLMIEGVDKRVLDKARYYEVIRPLRIVVLIASVFSLLVIVPFVLSQITNIVLILNFVGGIALCFILVAVGAYTSNLVAHNLNVLDYRADD